MRFLKLSIIFTFGTVFLNGLFAQNGTISPYSFIGIGDVAQAKTVEEISMGGVGTAFDDGLTLTFSNPASYAGIQFTSFSMGAAFKQMSFDDGQTKETGNIASVSYLALGFPLGKNVGFIMGLMPSSNVGYSLGSFNIDDDGFLIESTLYEGSGATNRVFAGLGFQLFKGLSVGAEGEYVFGQISRSVLNQRTGVQYATRYVTDVNVTGFRGNVGLMYNKVLNKNYKLSLGTKISLNSTINSNGDQFFFPVNLQEGEDVPKDLEFEPTPVNGDMSVPVRFDMGLGFGKLNNWFAEVDYVIGDGPSQSGSAFPAGDRFFFDKYQRASVGGYFIPKYNSIDSYWSRVTYRAGVKYEQSGLFVDTNNNGGLEELNDFGISFGVGLPLRSAGSKINIGLEMGSRGDSSQGLINENYFNFRLSMSLLDKWFNKRKIN